MYGCSGHYPDGRSVRPEMAMDDDDCYIGGDFKMELDYGKKTLTLEENGEKVTIDSKIGDFQYSPIVILHNSTYDDKFEITLL